MLDNSWIKLSRKILNNFIWDFNNPKYAMAWIDILLMANYSDKKVLLDGKVETVARGSLLTSIVKLSDRWRMTRKTVKRLLDMLQSEGMITYKSTKRYTTIFVSNYAGFQGFLKADGTTEDTTEDTTEGTTEDTTEDTTEGTAEDTTEGTTHYPQHKNIKKDKERKESKKGKKENSIRPSERPAVCEFDSQELKEAWEDFIAMRKEIKKPLSESAKKRAYNTLKKLAERYNDKERYMLECLSQTIINGWQGLFEVKDFIDGKAKLPPPPPFDPNASIEERLGLHFD